LTLLDERVATITWLPESMMCCCDRRLAVFEDVDRPREISNIVSGSALLDGELRR
jgi:hypothetical protein